MFKIVRQNKQILPVKCDVCPAISLLNNTVQVLTNETYFVLNLESLIDNYNGYRSELEEKKENSMVRFMLHMINLIHTL